MSDPLCKCGKPESKHGRHGCPFVPASLTWSDKDGPLLAESSGVPSLETAPLTSKAPCEKCGAEVDDGEDGWTLCIACHARKPLLEEIEGLDHAIECRDADLAELSGRLEAAHSRIALLEKELTPPDPSGMRPEITTESGKTP